MQEITSYSLKKHKKNEEQALNAGECTSIYIFYNISGFFARLFTQQLADNRKTELFRMNK
jgi:hypothetical protein